MIVENAKSIMILQMMAIQDSYASHAREIDKDTYKADARDYSLFSIPKFPLAMRFAPKRINRMNKNQSIGNQFLGLNPAVLQT